jgi:antitoxin component YwqK of YwqJK toxin-antitoxin module
MKKLFVCLVLINSVLCFSQNITSKVIKKDDKGNTLERVFFDKNNKEIAHLYFDSEGNQLKLEGNIPDGVVIKSFYDNGNLQRESIYKNNKRNGIQKEYNENGKISFEGYFKDDKQEGIIKTYYKNGKLQYELNFKNGILEGIAKIYNENGILKEEANYINGKLDGIFKKYYDSGKLESEYNYKDNNVDTLINKYDDKGKLLTEKFFRNVKWGMTVNDVKKVETAQFEKEEKNPENGITTLLQYKTKLDNNDFWINYYFNEGDGNGIIDYAVYTYGYIKDVNYDINSYKTIKKLFIKYKELLESKYGEAKLPDENYFTYNYYKFQYEDIEINKKLDNYLIPTSDDSSLLYKNMENNTILDDIQKGFLYLLYWDTDTTNISISASYLGNNGNISVDINYYYEPEIKGYNDNWIEKLKEKKKNKAKDL